jgi:hypothetical protein
MAEDNKPDIITFGPDGEADRRVDFANAIRQCPVPDAELLMNAGMFLTPQTLGRVLFMDFLYRQIIDVQGVVMEFGCRWGQNSALLSSLRGIYEPFNRLRKVVAFDTFQGFPSVAEEDGVMVAAGDYATGDEYADYLAKVLAFQESESPLDHIQKHEIVKGDVTKTVPKYMDDNSHTVVALAYFDLDLYEPTKACLEAICDRVTKGTVIAFDEANDASMPGETRAIAEALGLPNIALKRFAPSARTSYFVVD